MNKKLDLKNRTIHYYDVDTQLIEDEAIGFLDRNMKIKFYSAHFNNRKWVFLGDPNDRTPGALTVNGYRKKQAGENISVSIG